MIFYSPFTFFFFLFIMEGFIKKRKDAKISGQKRVYCDSSNHNQRFNIDKRPNSNKSNFNKICFFSWLIHISLITKFLSLYMNTNFV